MALGPLTRQILESGEIEGIKIKDQKLKMALFADDILLFLTNPAVSLPTLMNILTNTISYQSSR